MKLLIIYKLISWGGVILSLIETWRKDKLSLSEKRIEQLISFAGDGRLKDGSDASVELRSFLEVVDSEYLTKYVEQCLQNTFDGSGYALQDLVNEIGKRLDYTVIHGRYRGAKTHPGHDGLWLDEATGHNIVVEVKTTSAYLIDLDIIAQYRQALINNSDNDINLSNSSMLIVVGRQDTGGLEAQIRGSQHAWDMRLISVEALINLLKLKEEVEDPSILHRIHGILIPKEFTRLDQIIDIAFAAVEDMKQEGIEPSDNDNSSAKKTAPVSFHSECISRIEHHLTVNLIKKSRSSLVSSDGSLRLVISASRYHEREKRYWFSFHPHHNEFLSKSKNSYIAFGCGSADSLFLIPFNVFEPWLKEFNTTDNEDRFYWHVKIYPKNDRHLIVGKAGTEAIDITEYKI